jgi:cytochrome c oxidase subunit 2
MTDTRREYDDLFNGLYLPLVVVVAIAVFSVVGFALVRYRSGRGHTPTQERDRTKAEVAYVGVLAVIVAVLVAFTFAAESDITRGGTARSHITVTAFQWGWRFDYGNGKVVVGNERTLPLLVVPAGETVGFTLMSRDVIHAFWVPRLRFKRDAFPRRTTTFDLVFAEPGSDPGNCAEFCGLHHAEMRFGVRALPRSEFDAWLAAR